MDTTAECDIHMLLLQHNSYSLIILFYYRSSMPVAAKYKFKFV